MYITVTFVEKEDVTHNLLDLDNATRHNLGQTKNLKKQQTKLKKLREASALVL